MTPISERLKLVLYGTAAVNLVVGTLFLFGPELDLTPWPTPISPVLTRFIGAIILGNSAGSFAAARQATWEGARVLFTVALGYGIVVLLGVPTQIALGGGHRSLWIYVAVDVVFIGPIAYTYFAYERRRK